MNTNFFNDQLQGLLDKVQDQAARAMDYICDSKVMLVGGNREQTSVIVEQDRGVPTQEFQANDLAFEQICQGLKIDIRTGRHLRATTPDAFHRLLGEQLHHHDRPKLLRTLDQGDGRSPILRAVLSDRFKTFDHVDMLQTTLPQLRDSEARWEVVRGDITERAMHITLKSLVHTGEPAVGDTMALGLRLRNSETGAGSVEVAQLIWTLACLNGMQTNNRNRWAHLTSARSDGDTWAILTDQAKDADNQALALKLRDIVGNYASRESFNEVLENMAQAHQDGVVNAEAAVQAIGKQFVQVTKKDTSLILQGLIDTMGQAGYQGRPVTRATLVNAVTAVAHKKDPDDKPAWEKLGGQILTMAPGSWRRIAEAELIAA